MQRSRAMGWVVLLAACGKDFEHPTPDARPPLLSGEERAKIATHGPVPELGMDTTNIYAHRSDAAKLGQMLFFDKSYSGPLAVDADSMNGGVGMVGDTGKVACASCHATASSALDDRRSTPNNVSLGTDFGTRNALALVNASYYEWTNWGGRFDSQWSLPLAVAENPKIMNSTRLAVAHMLYAKYCDEYNAVFEPDLDPALDPHATDAHRFPPTGKPGQAAYDGMDPGDKLIVDRIYANYGKALHAYMRRLVSRDAPFDRWVAGDEAAIGEREMRGIKVFLASGCQDCHSGPLFTDNKFHAIGTPQRGDHVPAEDLGRFTDVVPLLASPFNVDGAYSDNTDTNKLDGLAQVDALKGQFRTPSLRTAMGSGPYMHAGQLPTLLDVFDFYQRGGDDIAGVVKDPLMVPRDIDIQDQRDLIDFLASLQGEPISPELLVDTSK